jgi:hypothetical protein
MTFAKLWRSVMLNPEYELERLEFYRRRDGIDGAVAAAKQMRKVYLAACKALRAKYGRNFPFRRGYIESAYSARHLLRTRLRELVEAREIIHQAIAAGKMKSLSDYTLYPADLPEISGVK